MTGLYSDELGGADEDSSSIDVPPEDSESSSAEPLSSSGGAGRPSGGDQSSDMAVADTVIKCHSRQPSSGIVADKSKSKYDDEDDLTNRDCGLLGCRPAAVQSFARIKVGVRFEYYGWNKFISL